MSRPAIITVPLVGASRPPRTCSSVVFPEPEAPTMATRSPAATLNDTPRSTGSSTGPWRKLLCTWRASRTASFMAQRLRRRGARRAPCRIDGRQRAQHEGHAAHLEHVESLDVGRQIAQVVDARVDELHPGEALERADESLEVVGQQRAKPRAEERPGEPDEDPLYGEGGEHVARRGPE